MLNLICTFLFLCPITENLKFILFKTPCRYEDEIGCAMENTPEVNDCNYSIEETNGGRCMVIIDLKILVIN